MHIISENSLVGNFNMHSLSLNYCQQTSEEDHSCPHDPP